MSVHRLERDSGPHGGLREDHGHGLAREWLEALISRSQLLLHCTAHTAHFDCSATNVHAHCAGSAPTVCFLCMDLALYLQELKQSLETDMTLSVWNSLRM